MRLDREQIVAAALRLLDEVGVDGLTMRVLADALKIQAPSLYWHFKNKQSLLEAMADALIAPVARAVPPGSWAEQVSFIAWELRAALRSRRDGARVFAGTFSINDNVIRTADHLIGVLMAAGLPRQKAAWGALTVTYFVLGFTIEEQGAYEPGGSEGVALAARREEFTRFIGDRYPHVAACIPDIFDGDQDARFRLGLEMQVAGLKVLSSAS
ncbi:TetR/AcrR family transcriptional regulator C-terminal domain-containing protein [Niveispirillum fermenti]|uniref:TetR/AcrR family transcriptional regulator C-terminal domain-containing protein n=1 Tax=Niveispirillum fermenti TaxID=1233113 RepID=UPI003A849016